MADYAPLVLLGVILNIWVGLASGMGLDLGSQDLIEDDDDRAIVVATGLNFDNVLGFNLTNLLPLLALAAAGLLPLLCLCALAAVALLALASKHDSGYSGYSSSSYSEYSRALGLDEFDWEKISIIDWISLGEETFRKFDPSILECHKRVICELNQNAQNFGSVVSRFVNMLGYLRYAELLSLPEEVKSVFAEYTDAADRGRSLKKNCGDIYTECDFSIKALHDRYSHNSL